MKEGQSQRESKELEGGKKKKRVSLCITVGRKKVRGQGTKCRGESGGEENGVNRKRGFEKVWKGWVKGERKEKQGRRYSSLTGYEVPPRAEEKIPEINIERRRDERHVHPTKGKDSG